MVLGRIARLLALKAPIGFAGLVLMGTSATLGQSAPALETPGALMNPGSAAELTPRAVTPTATVAAGDLPQPGEVFSDQATEGDGDESAREALSDGVVTAPNMLGDFIGLFYLGPPPPSDLRTIRTPLAFAQQRSATRFKAADNNSPLPRTRVLYSFNYFSNAFEQGGELYRQFAGVELAGFGNRVSVDLRGNGNTLNGFQGGNGGTDWGNLYTNFKGVLYSRGAQTYSAGLLVGWPVGATPRATPNNNYYLAPWVGYLFARPGSRWFIQGFEQVDFPTSSDDTVLVHTDIGVGGWIIPYRRGRVLNGLAPTLEMHLYTPVGSQPTGALLGLRYNDVWNLTLGVTLFVIDEIQIAMGIGTPLLARRDYDVEAQLHVNVPFGWPSRWR